MNKNYQLCAVEKAILIFCLLFCCLQHSIAQFQTQTKIPDTFLSTYCNGYLESLPVDYSSSPSKKYPLIIFMHGAGGIGTGTSSQLDKVTSEGLPEYIKDGAFPSSFTVGGETYSFIVISPQLSSTSSTLTSLQNVLNYCVANYRVDTTKIYLTGLSLGGRISWDFTRQSARVNRIAASMLVCPGSIAGIYSDVASAAGANLPLWITSNLDDASAPVRRSDSLVNFYYNNYSPAPSPLAKLTVFTGSDQPSDKHDAWTKTYNPVFKEDGLNIYEWMLQYTNKKLVANAGLDRPITLPQDTVITVDGTKSIARQGRITAYLWTKLTGPSGGTITNTTDSITTITALGAGRYTFELKVTHTDASTARDTIVVSTQTQTPVVQNIHSNIGGYYESLPVLYNDDSAKKFPLLIFVHGADGRGDGSLGQLPRILTNETGVTMAERIENGTFPAIVTSGGKEFSFIAISPQLKSGATSVSSEQIKAVIDSCVLKYRVDTNRIYLTGIGMGGKFAWQYAGDSAIYADRLAALMLVAPAFIYPYTARATVVANSDLPIWTVGNYGDTSTSNRATLNNVINLINASPPTPAAKLNIIDSSSSNGNDSWTEVYNPTFRRDGKNVYEWMLSYTRPQGSPRKSQPLKDSVQTQTENAAILNVRINPNPVRSNLTVWITGKSKGRSSLTLYNMQGQRLSQQQFIKDSESPVSRVVNASNLPAGHYAIQVIVSKKYTKLVRFVKE